MSYNNHINLRKPLNPDFVIVHSKFIINAITAAM